MTKEIVIENPVINSPFTEPQRYFRFAEEGITNEIVDSRRISAYFIPIAQPRKKSSAKQLSFDTEYKWTHARAVLFLYPFGMQVEWDTMEAIAKTKAIDVWILFPLGIAVNRLLKRDGNIEDAWRKRLDSLFGTTEWFSVFYKEQFFNDLFEKTRMIRKICTLEGISIFYIERLKTIFPRVAEKPRPLCNSKGNPLFHLCFAVSNPKGADLAMKIAKHILEG